MVYDKPFKTFSEQVKILQSRGLLIKKNDEAELILKQINYYRFSAYSIPFQKEKDKFNKGTTLENVIKLYEFDSKLRLHLFSWMEKIEIQLRTFVTYFLAKKYGKFGYTDKGIFSPQFKHTEWLNTLKEEQNRSSETFIKHYSKKYKDSTYLPIWMVTEIMSLGNLSRLFKGMKKQDQKNMSGSIGLNAPVMVSWMHHLTYIRNLCAHHSRIWNREMAIRPVIPNAEKWKYLKHNNKLFATLSIIIYLSDNFKLGLSVKEAVSNLFSNYPDFTFKIKTAMGFPQNYAKTELWRITSGQ